MSTLGLFGEGPLDRLVSRAGPSGSGSRRILLWIGVGWFPLLILSIIGALGEGPVPRMTFAQDFALHIRFFFAIPLLVSSESFVQRRLDLTVPVLRSRGILTERSVDAVMRIQERIRRAANSPFSDPILLTAVYAIVLSRTLLELPSELATWRTLGTPASAVANAWFQWVSVPIYLFMILRWLWRYAFWSHFLYRLSESRLRLQSLHPDLVGGLGYVSIVHLDFGIVATALSSVIASNVAEGVLYAGGSIEGFMPALVGFLAIVAAALFLPLLTFTPVLVRAKRDGLRNFGTFATRYTALFASKWVEPGADARKDPLGSPDIQSLNDLIGSYAPIAGMKLVLVGRQHLMRFAVFVLMPLLPLALFKIPLAQLIRVLAATLI